MAKIKMTMEELKEGMKDKDFQRMVSTLVSHEYYSSSYIDDDGNVEVSWDQENYETMSMYVAFATFKIQDVLDIVNEEAIYGPEDETDLRVVKALKERF